MKKLGVCIFFLCCAISPCFSATNEEPKEKFPCAGYIKTDTATVRAGDNANFEALCTLEKADKIKVMDKRYSWLKILLPQKAYLFIKKDYVDLTLDEKGIGIVNATNVNLRAGPGTRYSILGQVSKPEKLYIASEENGRYKVFPPYGISGWLHESQVDISEPEEKIGEQKTGKIKLKLNTGSPLPQGNLSISKEKR